MLLALAILAALSTPSHSLPTLQTPPAHVNWTTLPVAYHGGNQTGTWTDESIAQLAKYGMVTTEKWHTTCGGKHPVMNPPCDEEDAMLTALRKIRTINPNTIAMVYFNSVIDFSFYNFHEELAMMEEAGVKVWLRDKNGEVVTLDNDGSFYWNITRFDVTQPAMLQAWLAKVKSFFDTGVVQGVFADHGNKFLEKNKAGVYQLCDGKGDRAKCVEFTTEFGDAWNAAHVEQLAKVQAMADPFPAVDSLNATWQINACDYETHRAAVEAGKWVEAKQGGCATELDESCLAAFLTAAGDKSYFACFSSQATVNASLPKWFPEYDKPLGAPLSDPERHGDEVVRSFASGTKATFNLRTKKGSVQWAQ